MKLYYQDEYATIYHGDCREILPTLGPVDLVCVDPPYGINQASNRGASWNGTAIANDHDTSLRDFIVDYYPETPMIVFGNWKAARPIRTRQVLIWDKGPASGMGDLSFPWKPSFEEIYIIGDGWSGKRDEGVLKGMTTVTWESQGRSHPNHKPVSLMRYLIAKQPTAQIVLDACCGSGPVIRAAKDLGLKSIGIEIEERYCKIAANRLRQEVFKF